MIEIDNDSSNKRRAWVAMSKVVLNITFQMLKGNSIYYFCENEFSASKYCDTYIAIYNSKVRIKLLLYHPENIPHVLNTELGCTWACLSSKWKCIHIHILNAAKKSRSQWFSSCDSMFRASKIGLGRYAQKDDWS